MKIKLLLLTLITSTLFGQTIEIPADLNKENILVELNSFDQTVALLNKEFERTHDKDRCAKRKNEIVETNTPNNRSEIGDTYGVAYAGNTVDWLNEIIVKSIKKDKKNRFTVVNEQSLKNFPADKWRYVLRYKYIFLNGEVLETRIFFYYHDRQNNTDLINYAAADNLKLFSPLMFFTADKLYPFYDLIRIFSVKKELDIFFKEL